MRLEFVKQVLNTSKEEIKVQFLDVRFLLVIY